MPISGADSGFTVVGRPLMLVLFGENVSENERIGSRGVEGGEPENFVCRSANVFTDPFHK